MFFSRPNVWFHDFHGFHVFHGGDFTIFTLSRFHTYSHFLKLPTPSVNLSTATFQKPKRTLSQLKGGKEVINPLPPFFCDIYISKLYINSSLSKLYVFTFFFFWSCTVIYKYPSWKTLACTWSCFQVCDVWCWFARVVAPRFVNIYIWEI